MHQIPESIANLNKLRHLNISWNDISEIPKWIDSLANIEVLNFWGNKIEFVPEEIASLNKLKKIYLNFNKISESSKEIKKLREKGIIVNI